MGKPEAASDPDRMDAARGEQRLDAAFEQVHALGREERLDIAEVGGQRLAPDVGLRPVAQRLGPLAVADVAALHDLLHSRAETVVAVEANLAREPRHRVGVGAGEGREAAGRVEATAERLSSSQTAKPRRIGASPAATRASASRISVSCCMAGGSAFRWIRRTLPQEGPPARQFNCIVVGREISQMHYPSEAKTNRRNET